MDAEETGGVEQAIDQDVLARRLLPGAAPLLKELMKRDAGRVARDVARCFTLIAAAIALLWATQSPWVMALAFLVIGTQQHGLFILAHDGMHTTLLSTRRANDRLTTAVLFAPLVMALGDQKDAHLRHHLRVGHDDDPDRFLHAAENKATRLRFLLFLSGVLTIVPSIVRVSPFARSSEPLVLRLRALVATRGPAFVAQVTLFALFAALVSWWAYFAFWLGPLFALVAVPNQIRAFCEHAQPAVPDADADGHRLVTFRPSWIERQLLAPFNMNRHAEHHLWAFVPYYNLPRLHDYVAGCPQIEVRSSYVAFLHRYFKSLPLAPPAAG